MDSKTARFTSLVRENYFPSQEKSFFQSEKKYGLVRGDLRGGNEALKISSKCRIRMTDLGVGNKLKPILNPLLRREVSTGEGLSVAFLIGFPAFA